MKKFLFLAAALLALGISTACADSDRPIDVAQLPQKAQQFIQKHFAGEKVALAKVERDFLEVRSRGDLHRRLRRPSSTRTANGKK